MMFIIQPKYIFGLQRLHFKENLGSVQKTWDTALLIKLNLYGGDKNGKKQMGFVLSMPVLWRIGNT